MAEYIERDKLLKFKANVYDEDGHILYAVPTGYIVAMPPADVVPVRHGRWEWDTEDIYRCSNCAEKSHVKEVMGHPEWDYCPNCGAKMDGGDGNSAICSKTT